MLEAALLSADDLKRFCANLCCESYPIVDDLEKEIDELEKNWPRFHERDGLAAGDSVQWGAHRFGRIPPFIWKDEAPAYSSCYEDVSVADDDDGDDNDNDYGDHDHDRDHDQDEKKHD